MTTMSMKVYASAALSVATAMCALGATMGGCSSSSSSETTSNGDGGSSTKSSGTGTGNASSGASSSSGAVTCSAANDILSVAFSPMYTAVIPGDTTHTFAVPAVLSVSTDAITWSASSDAVSLTKDVTTGGVLITVNPMSTQFSASVPSTTVTITAIAGGSCGTSVLTITTTTEAAWQAGSARYNDGIALTAGGGGMGGGMGGPPATPDGGYRYACTDCHSLKAAGADAGFSPFSDIAHTPEQTGGFSDSTLLGIAQDGIVPGWSLDGGTSSSTAGYFDPSILSYDRWHELHQWGFTQAEQAGIVTYLRSLTPTAQDGTSNFGGFGGGGPPPDGGYRFHHDGGFMRPDGGFVRPDGGFGGGHASTTSTGGTGTASGS